MPKSAKIECKVDRHGNDAVDLEIKAKGEGFGSFRCNVRWDLESAKLANIAEHHCLNLREAIDGTEIGDEESLARYVAACTTDATNMLEEMAKELIPDK